MGVWLAEGSVEAFLPSGATELTRSLRARSDRKAEATPISVQRRNGSVLLNMRACVPKTLKFKMVFSAVFLIKLQTQARRTVRSLTLKSLATSATVRYSTSRMRRTSAF